MRVATFLLLSLLVLHVAGCSDSNPAGTDNNGDDNYDPWDYDYTTGVVTVLQQNVSPASGATLVVDDAESGLDGLTLGIPPYALDSTTTITIGEVSNPPALPAGLSFVGMPVHLGPDGLSPSSPMALAFPYSDAALSDAGVSDDSALELYCYDTTMRSWQEVPIITIDTSGNVVYAEIEHFSHYAITGLNGTAPADLGTPSPGDLLYKLSLGGWRPGHVGIYTGEKAYPGTGAASSDVTSFNKYNVVEALSGGVQYSYYDIPNVTETHESQLGSFAGDQTFMGSREPEDGSLTQTQRNSIVQYVEAQIGKPYAWAQTAGVLYGMLRGSLVKGPNSFNCVGLAEKAYEQADVNGGDGLTSFWQEETGVPAASLTPAEHYNQTKPAGGVVEGPHIEWASLTPDHGHWYTDILAQVSVSHTYGLSYISSVTYVTDDGYTNPNLYINDEGHSGDIEAGDGIYSVAAMAGGDDSWGEAWLTFTVTDVFGRADNARVVYTYDDKSVDPPPSIDRESVTNALFR